MFTRSAVAWFSSPLSNLVAVELKVPRCRGKIREQLQTINACCHRPRLCGPSPRGRVRQDRPTVGFDLRRARIEELRAGRDTTLEVEASDLTAAKYLSYTCAPGDLRGCTIFIVAVPTPIDRANRPDLTLLAKASETVGSVIKKGAIVIYEIDSLSWLHEGSLRAYS